MHFTPRFYRIAAICSVASAVTTLGLILLPELFAPAKDFAGRMARVHDPAYQVRAWVYLVHPFLVVAAALGVAMRLRRSAAGLVIPGLLAFVLWGSTEAAQQALTLTAFDPWREAYLAGEPAVRASMELRTALYDDLWDSMFFLLLIGFLIGNILYALAMWREPGLARALSCLYVAAAALTFLILSAELGGPTLPKPLEFWVYLTIQPLARTLIGVWLWRFRDESVSGPTAY